MSSQKSTQELREDILRAGKKAAAELIRVAESSILKKGETEFDLGEDLAADKLKNAAAAKRLCIEDALAILDRVDMLQSELDAAKEGKTDAGFQDFTQGRAG